MTSAQLVKVQAASGLAFSCFLVVHLLNTVSAVFAAGSYDAFQQVARLFYQNAVIELGCVALALVVHVASSLLLIRRRPPARAPLWLRLHRYSGYVLVCIVFVHAVATRGVGLLQGLPIAAEYVTFVLQAWPAFFYPYYALLFAAGAYHLVSGLRLALGRLGLPRLARGRPTVIYWLSGALMVAGLAGILALGGLFRAAPVPNQDVYQRFFDSMVP